MNKSFLFLGLAVLLLAACVSPVDFPVKKEAWPELVLDGGLTDGGFPQRIRLTRPGKLGTRVFESVVGASVTIFEENGPSEKLTERFNSPDENFYELAGNTLNPQPGRAYFLEIVLADGKTYRTDPQTMPARIEMDSLEIRGEEVQETAGADGVVLAKKAAIYAHSSRPNDGAKPGFLRWDMHSVWFFREPQLPVPLPPPSHICYVADFFNRNNVALENLQNRPAGQPFARRIGEKQLDFTFEKRQVFTVVQYSMSAEAGEYWRKIGETTAKNGSIFDTPPGLVRSNLVSDQNPQELILGWFEVSSVDTARAATIGGLGPGFYASGYCELVFSNGGASFGFNQVECSDCLLFPNSTYQPPHYW